MFAARILARDEDYRRDAKGDSYTTERRAMTHGGTRLQTFQRFMTLSDG